MGDDRQSVDLSSAISISSISDCNSLMLVHSQKRRLSEINDAANLSIVTAEKHSVEAALKEAQITSERDLKRARLEVRCLESEKSDLMAQIKTLERRLSESTENNDALKLKLQQVELDASERIETILHKFKQDEILSEKVDELHAQLGDLKIELANERQEKLDLLIEKQTLTSQIELTEKKLSILQSLRDEDVVALKEAENWKSKVNELESENLHLKDQLEQALHGPGNASSLLSRPDGSGLCLRSSSILYSTRLEQKVAHLESENAKLLQSKAQLVIARTELEDLKATLARANEWQDRALLAEEKLANQTASAFNESLADAQLKLAQCQRENALILSEIGNLRSELSATAVELKRAKLKIAALTEEETKSKAAVECMQSRSRRQNLRLKILQNERNMYKQFVDSYADADATLSSPAGEMLHVFQQMVDEVASSLNEFYAKVESDDNELERLVREVESAAVGINAHSVADVSSADLVLSANDRRSAEQLRLIFAISLFLFFLYRETIRELEERLEKVETTKQLAEQEIAIMRAQGAYNPDETQVLHIISNPAEQARARREDELITLRKENANLLQRAKVRTLTTPDDSEKKNLMGMENGNAFTFFDREVLPQEWQLVIAYFCSFQILKDRLDRLYELRGQGDSSIPDSALAPGNVTMAVAESLKDHPDPISELRRLQVERQAEDRRHKKLMERFGELSSEFREACALLFGFGLHIRQSGIYKVVPLHAPFGADTYMKSSKATEFIKFKRTGDTITIMETTLVDEVVADFMNCRLPIPLALARLLLLANGVRVASSCEESTMLM
ncbi:unnamed protein product [Rodentolepis nana]|uniref:Protein bicaudal D n=1 Tax=Rodentolepis nana TaxID=102285 RepID=A0A0R3TW49_RODNA|nr:unnamed protein product [Rodentolepis nana]